jgi:hypothetical protein
VSALRASWARVGCPPDPGPPPVAGSEGEEPPHAETASTMTSAIDAAFAARRDPGVAEMDIRLFHRS